MSAFRTALCLSMVVLSFALIASYAFGAAETGWGPHPTAGQAHLERAHVGSDTQSLIAALANEDGVVRALAAEELGRRGSHEAIPQLKPLLSDPVAVVRLRAAGALLALGDESGLDALRGMLADRNSFIAREAAALFAARGDQAVIAQFRPKMTSDKETERLDALMVLSASSDEAVASGALRSGLSDSSRFVRRMAMDVLSRKSSPWAVELAAPLLKSADENERFRALLALNRMRRAESIPHLIGCLTDASLAGRILAAGALRSLTGRDLSREAAGLGGARALQQKWQEWWEANKATFVVPPAPAAQ